MIKHLAALTLAIPLVAGVGTVNLTVTETGGVTRTNFPVRAGIPISSAANVTDVDSLRMTDNGDTVIVSDLEVLSRWGGSPSNPSKPIKVVLANFQASVSASGSATYKLKDSAASEPTPPTLTVTDNTDHWEIDAGTCTFEIDQSGGFRFLRQVDVGETALISQDVADLYVVEDSTTYSASNGTISLAERERSGDMFEQIHIKGDLHDGVSTSALLYDARLRFHAGSCAVHAEVTIIFDQDMYDFRPSDLGISLPLNLGANYTFDSQGTQISMTDSDRAYLLQEDSDAWYLYKNVTQQDSGSQSDGAASLFDSSLGVAVWKRWAWQEYPWEVEADADTLNLHFWPIDADFPTLVAAKETEALGSGLISQIFPYRQSNLLDLRARSEGSSSFLESDENAYGIAKTWELVLEFHGATAKDPEQLADEWANPLMPWNGAHFTSSSVFGDLGEDVTGLDANDILQITETTLSAVYDQLDDRISDWHLYGLFVFGDHCYMNSAGAGNRLWLDTRHHWNASRPIQYVRTGSGTHLDRAQATSRHIADVDVSHLTAAFTDGNSQAVDKVVGGLVCTHGVGAAHWTNESWGRPTCTSGTAEPHVDDPGLGWLYMYYLAGEDRLYDVLLERAGRLVATGPSTPTGARQVSNLASLSAAYELTWDSNYLTAADVIADEALLDHDSGGFEVPILGFLDGGTESPGWSVFFSPWAEQGMVHYQRITGDAGMLALLKRFGKSLTAHTHDSDAHGTEQWQGAGSAALAHCYQRGGCTATDAIPALRRELAGFVISKRILADVGGYDFAHNATMFTVSVPYAMAALQTYGDYNDIAGETLPAQGVSLADDETTTFYVYEASDGTITIRFSVSSGNSDPTFSNWQEPGNINFKLYDPEDTKIFDQTFDDADISNSITESYAGGVDNRYVEVEVSSDGKTGTYRLEVVCDQPYHMIYPVYVSTGKLVVHAPRTGPTGLGRGVWWLQGPDGTDDVTIGWHSTVGAIGPHWQTFPGDGTSQTLYRTNEGGLWGWWYWGAGMTSVHQRGVEPYVKDTKPLFAPTPEMYFDVASISVDTTAISYPYIKIDNTGSNQSPPSGSPPPVGAPWLEQGAFVQTGAFEQ